MLFCVIIILTVIFYLLYIFVVWMKKNISNMKNFLKIKSLDWIWCGNSDDAKICRGPDHCVRTHTYIYYTFRTTCRNNIADGSCCTMCCNWVQTIQLVIWFKKTLLLPNPKCWFYFTKSFTCCFYHGLLMLLVLEKWKNHIPIDKYVLSVSVTH